MDFEHALDVMLEYGVTSAELRSLWDVNIADLSDEQIEKAKAALKSRSMTVSCIASPLYKCDLGGSETGAVGRTHQATGRGLDQQMGLLERCIHLCDLFDTRLIRIFAFWKKGELTGDVEQRIIRTFAEPVARAAEAGVILALENEHACYLGTGRETARVLQAVGSPALRGVWDPGNALCAGEKKPYPDGYEAMKEFIVHIHLKDAVMECGKHRWVCMGEGEIDYIGQFRALEADGYEGCLSLETHYRPGGDKREQGSRECLAGIQKMLANL
jgi:sugar phosphate isomerase/epimerase